jgi:uroporphyrinogen-III synthase
MKRLEGKVIAVTRPINRSEEAATIIEAEGGVPLLAPTLELQMTHTDSLKELCKTADMLDWLIFTSPSSLDSLFKFCPDFNVRLNPDCMVAVIGPRTARALEEYGLPIDILPDNYTAEGLLEVMKDYPLEGKIIGIPRTFSARDVLPQGLRKMGAQILLAEAYTSTIPQDKKPALNLIESLINGEVYAITFTSPLTVHNLIDIAGEKKEILIEILKDSAVIVVSIGPITGAALEEYDIKYISPDKYTVKDMLNKLMEEMI